MRSNNIDILEKIRQLRLERNWTEYQLALYSNIPQSTISSWYRKNQIPTVASIEKICDAFKITLSQFFLESNKEMVQLTKRQAELLDNWNKLDDDKQEAIAKLLKLM